MRAALLPIAARVCLPLALTIPVFAQRYIVDDGKPTVQVSTWFPTPIDESGTMQAFSVPGGGTDTIESISVVFTTFWYLQIGGVVNIDGTPVRIAVWDDPDGDRNPQDAVLLAESSGHVAANTGSGQFVTYNFPTPVPVSGDFFIGATVETVPGGRTGYAVIDESEGYRFDSWYMSNAGGPLDLANLDLNTGPPSNILLTGRFLLRANDGDYGSPVGSVSCLPTLNSTGRRGKLSATGYSNSGSGPWRVALTATDLPAGSFGMFVASKTIRGFVTPPGSVGRLCLSGSILRIDSSIQATDDRMMVHDVDLTNIDGLGTGVPGIDAVVAGETWFFQAWHRDANPGPTSNLTEMLGVYFQ